MKVPHILVACALAAGIAEAAPAVSIRLPERFRVLTDQRFDLRIEATGIANQGASVDVFFANQLVTQDLGTPEIAINNDADPSTLDKTWTFRNVSLPKAGVVLINARVNGGNGIGDALARVGVQDFKLRGQKNIILFIGDGMGTKYRDLGRIVAKATEGRFREGFFDELQEMDKMPVSGMVMTYAFNRLVPDSANTAAAWSTGNKTVDGALGVFPDNTDFKAGFTQESKVFALDNPRVETLWEYLKRRHGYKTGIVTTADVTDATPAGEGSHVLFRGLGFDIARQYVDGVFTDGPTFDVIMGGGKERFDARNAANSGDARNLTTELQAKGFTYITTRTELNALPANTSKLLGLFRVGNMNVAYDKLGLVRPPGEAPSPFDGFNDQPFLDEMTAKAISTLGSQGRPFILMVEGASIDKQSHANFAAGQIWDTIEFDKAVGVGRTFAASTNTGKRRDDTLLVVTADHDQSVQILGIVDTATPNATQNVRYFEPYVGVSGEVLGFPDYDDANGDGYPENTNRYRVSVGYRTNGHTGSSVPVTAEGSGALLFSGYYDQTDLFFKMARVLSSNTKPLDDALEEKKKLDSIDQNY
jgi:alkaline phosphatase